MTFDERLVEFRRLRRLVDEAVDRMRLPPLVERQMREALADEVIGFQEASDAVARRDAVGRSEAAEATRGGAADAADGAAVPTVPVVGAW